MEYITGCKQNKGNRDRHVCVKADNGLIFFKRFTLEQEQLYRKTNQDFYRKTFSTSGIELLFKTDSENLFLKLKVLTSSSGKYFEFSAGIKAVIFT